MKKGEVMDMGFKSDIKEIFSDMGPYHEKVMLKGYEYVSFREKARKAKEELYECMNEETKEMFESFIEFREILESMYADEVFRHGMALGVRITAESFLLEN